MDLNKRRTETVDGLKKVLTNNVTETSKLTFCFHTRNIAFRWSSRNLSGSKISYLILLVFHLRYILNLAA